MKLHDYQIVARDFLRGRDRAALFLDMGLGKTAAALTALEERHLPVLVVAPKRVAESVWSAETAIWRPDLTISVAKGDPAARGKALSSKADIVVLGRDNLRDLLSKRVDRDTPFKTIVLDEMSSFKTRASVRWKTARRLVKDVEHVWGLTGTPSPNGLLDLWAQIFLLDNGGRLGHTLTTYRSRYFMPGRQLPNGVTIEWNLREEAEANIHKKLEDIALSMKTDGRIDLPPITYNPVEIELPPAVRKQYKTLSDTLVTDLRELFGGEVHTAGNAAILTTRLSQMAAGFIYVDDAEFNDYRYTVLHKEKVNAVKEIVDGTGSPVMVMYSYAAERELLKEVLGDDAHTIDEPDVIERWNRGEIPVLLAHPASAGHGLNLQHGGHTQVWTSLTWDLELWDQGIKRLWRQGQEQPVIIHLVVAKNTVDQLIRARLVDKAKVQDRLLEHLESPL